MKHTIFNSNSQSTNIFLGIVIASLALAIPFNAYANEQQPHNSILNPNGKPAHTTGAAVR